MKAISDMLLDNFYKICRIEETNSHTWEVTVELTPQHAVYHGHFPEHPIVPGVAMLQIIKESAAQICQQSLQYAQIASSKFLSAIDPTKDSTFTLTIKLEESEDMAIKIQAEGSCAGKEFIKLKASLIKK